MESLATALLNVLAALPIGLEFTVDADVSVDDVPGLLVRELASGTNEVVLPDKPVAVDARRVTGGDENGQSRKKEGSVEKHGC